LFSTLLLLRVQVIRGFTKVTHQLQSPLVAIPREMLLDEEAPYLSPASDTEITAPLRPTNPPNPVEKKPLLLHESNAELNTIATVIDSVRKRQLEEYQQQQQQTLASPVVATAGATPVWADRVKALQTRSIAIDEPAPLIALSPGLRLPVQPLLLPLHLSPPYQHSPVGRASSPVPMCYSPIQTPKANLRQAYASYAERARSASPVRAFSPPKRHHHSIHQPLPVSSPLSRAQSYQNAGSGFGTSQLAQYTLPPLVRSPSPPRSVVVRPEQTVVRAGVGEERPVLWNRGTQMEAAAGGCSHCGLGVPPEVPATACQSVQADGPERIDSSTQMDRLLADSWTQCEAEIADAWTQCDDYKPEVPGERAPSLRITPLTPPRSSS